MRVFLSYHFGDRSLLVHRVSTFSTNSLESGPTVGLSPVSLLNGRSCSMTC